jgi:hypothetical protein
MSRRVASMKLFARGGDRCRDCDTLDHGGWLWLKKRTVCDAQGTSRRLRRHELLERLRDESRDLD